MTQAVKVYQIAQELGMDTDAVVARIRAFGINVNNKMSKVDGGVAEQIKSSLLREKQQQEWVEVDMGNGVIKRVRRPQPAPVAVAPAPVVEPARVERAEISTPAVAAEPEPELTSSQRAPAASTKSAPAPSAEQPVERETSGETRALEPAVTPASAPPRSEPIAQASEPEPVPAPNATAVAPVSEPSVPRAEARHEAAPRATAATPSSKKPSRREAEASAEGSKPAARESKELTKEPTAPPATQAAPAASTPAAAANTASVAVEPPRVEETHAPAATASEATPVEPVREAAKPDVIEAAPAVSSAPAPTTAAAPPAVEAEPTPSQPPQPEARPSVRPSMPPKTGVSTWDPTTRTVTHTPSPTSAPGGYNTRRIEVDRGRLTGSTALSGGVRPKPAGMGGGRPGLGGRPIPGRPGMGRRPVGPANVSTKAMGAEKRVVKIEGQVSLQELARRMSVKASDVLMALLKLGMPGVNINSSLDADTAKIVAQEFQYEVDDVAVDIDDALKAILPEFKDNPADHQRRPAVVTVMGHVDHGKTTLLDAVLGMRVAEGEAGGITQKVSAYRVETKKGPVVFFDTPGHEAFTKLRARGAETTDVAVLVVAADDGVMPTTVEAIHHVQAAENVPIVVALNKMDKPDAKPERVLTQLMEYGVVAEEFGGETLVVKVSAKQRTGIEDLLENLALQSEILDLDSNPKAPGVGTVFDATLDKGRGVVTRFLVQDGTVRTGDVVLAGTAFGKIRAMFDDRGKPITKAGPSSPVEILGLNELPNSGDKIYVVQDLKKAQQFADEHKKKGPSGPGRQAIDINTLLSQNEQLTVGVIIKAEAQASVEALTEALTKLSTEKVKVQVVHSGIGGITESDVNLAIASNKFPTTIIGFNVRPQGKSQQLADSEKIPVKLYTIIYEAVDDMKALMEGQLKPTVVEKPLGKAEVRQVFTITKVGTIAGSYVIEGKVARTARARLVRDSVQIWEGKVASLRRFKEDAKEVAQGYECGIGLENYADIKPGDIIEFFELEEIATRL